MSNRTSNPLLVQAKWLRQCAAEIAKAGHNGWGNTCLGAAEAIEAYCRQPDETDTSPLAGCGNWKPKHGVGPYCGNCGFHESEHRDTYPYTRTVKMRGQR